MVYHIIYNLFVADPRWYKIHHKQGHFFLWDEPIFVDVHFVEIPAKHDVWRWWQTFLGHKWLDETKGLLSIQLATPIRIEVVPNLVHNVLDFFLEWRNHHEISNESCNLCFWEDTIFGLIKLWEDFVENCHSCWLLTSFGEDIVHKIQGLFPTQRSRFIGVILLENFNDHHVNRVSVMG